ncbi:MAG: carotenoid oxygenase family protein [Pseudomonadota bacterium]
MLHFIRKYTNSDTNHRYQNIPFAPVKKEQTYENLDVEGAIPKDLNGLYVRNGPNPAGEISPYQHYFSGDGMVHGIYLKSGSAKWYRNRFVCAGEVPKKLGKSDLGGPVTGGLDVSPNTNIVAFDGQLYATIEAGASMVALSDLLETQGRSDLNGTLKFGFTGHHKIDPVDGDIHAVTYGQKLGKNALYQRLTPQGRLKNSVKIPLTGMTQIHDMAITENYAIILDMNVVFSLTTLLKTTLPIKWDENKECRIGLVPKSGNAHDVRWFTIDPSYAYHVMNAYETDKGDVVLDVSRYEYTSKHDMFGPLGDTPPSIYRYVLPVNNEVKHAGAQPVFNLPLDFPKINPYIEGRDYRYGYAVEATLEPAFKRAAKLDFHKNTVLYQDFNGGMSSELTFIPKGREEDDGWLIGFVFQPELQRSRLVIMDARDFEADPVASIWIPDQYVPIGTHGGWFPA